jgi:type I restriction enzyme S subunit
MDLNFVFKVFNTLRLDELGKGIKPGLSRSEVYALPVAIPPLAEQRRIVNKVDELMGLCDRLEAEQTDAEAAQARLVETLLGALIRSTDAADLATNWQRIAEYFEGFFTSESSISALKKTILQLAVMGKLVPRDPNENPIAGELGDFADFLNGYAFKSEWFTKSGIRLLRNTNVSHGHCDWTDASHLPYELLQEFKRFQLAAGDLVLSLDRPIINTGLKIARMSREDLPCLLLQRVAKVAPRDNLVDIDYLFIWFNSPAFTHMINPGRSNGIPHISTKQIAGLPFIRFSMAEQKAIVATVNELMELCECLKADIFKSRNRQTQLASALIESVLNAA